jgi:hypothetical protein
MLRRATSWREKQKTAECHAALLKTRSIILKAISIDYEDVSCETQSHESTGQTGAVSASVSLDPGEQPEDICAIGTASQDYCEHNVTVCSVGTEQPDNTTGQSGMFPSISVHTASPSEPSDLAWEEETRGVVQARTSQEVDQQLSLVGRANRWLQVDVGVSEGNYDSDSTAYFSPCTPLISPVPTEQGVSSEADEVILKVADQLSLADEICEVEGNAEQLTEVSMCSGVGTAVRILSHTATP